MGARAQACQLLPLVLGLSSGLLPVRTYGMCVRACTRVQARTGRPLARDADPSSQILRARTPRAADCARSSPTSPLASHPPTGYAMQAWAMSRLSTISRAATLSPNGSSVGTRASLASQLSRGSRRRTSLERASGAAVASSSGRQADTPHLVTSRAPTVRGRRGTRTGKPRFLRQRAKSHFSESPEEVMRV